MSMVIRLNYKTLRREKMQIEKANCAETPTLVAITSVANSIPRNRYAVYYELPIYAGMYKSIEEVQDLLLVDNCLRFKILDLQMVPTQPILKEASFESDQGRQDALQLVLKLNQGQIMLKGVVINRSQSSDVVFSLSVEEVGGYLNFLKYRQKYRTLQNITRKQVFKLDHCIKIIDGNSSFKFPLESSDRSRYFFTNRQLMVQVQEIYSVEEWHTTEILFEGVIDLKQADACVKATITIMQKITICFKVELIKNTNLSACQLAALRVFQVSPPSADIFIGTDKFGDMAQVTPVLGGRFYDYEYAYINQNLHEEKRLEVYKQVDKITKSFPNYPHLKNCKLLELSGSKLLSFWLSGETGKRLEKIAIPFVYLLPGFNIIQTENSTIKFYIQFSEEEKSCYADSLYDRRRLIQAKISGIWNIGEVGRVYRNFDLKMISTGLICRIPFRSEEVDVKDFRKEQKELEVKQQCSEMQGSKYFVLSTGTDSKKLLLTKSESIAPFYLFDLYSSASLSFQIVTSSGEIVLQATVQRERIIDVCRANSKDAKVKIVISSADSLSKVVILLECKEIIQSNESLRTYYKLLYRLEYRENAGSEGAQYDLEIRRTTDNKKQRAKVRPEIGDDGISSLHCVEDGFFESTDEDMELRVSLRKMFYDEQTETFDNSELISKKIVVNPLPGRAIAEDVLFLMIKEEGYNSVQFDLYDDSIKKRLVLHLEFVMRKLPLMDLRKGKYLIKIPQFLWELNKLNQWSGQMLLQSHLSHQKRRGEKIQIFPDSPQQYSLQQYGWKDSLSLSIDNQIGYDRVIDSIRVRCEVTKNQIGWVQESEWYLAAISVGAGVFWFLIKWAADVQGTWDHQGQQEDAESNKSDRTAGKKGSERSHSQRIDPLAKTVKNMQLLKLKQYRNNLVVEGRMLTTKFVKKQETILKYTKKIGELEEKIRKQAAVQKQAIGPAGEPQKRGSAGFKKMAEFYRSICQCGERNPKYNGYCQVCLKALKSRYEAYSKQYKEKSYEYERVVFNRFNMKEKYLTVKNKLRELKQRLNEGKDIDDDNIYELATQMQNSELKQKIEEAKVELFRLKDERQKLESSAHARLKDLEDRIRKEDEDIWKSTIELQQLTTQLSELRMQIHQPQSQY